MPRPAPIDPRLAWNVPALGTMPAEVDLDELTTRVLAPNSSHITLDGTNTYVIAVPGSGTAIVVDPGPTDDAHRDRVEQALARRDLECAVLLITHHHIDHAAAGQPWSEAFGAELVAPTREVAGENGRVIGEGDVIEAGDLRIEAIATPGHCHDHTSYRLPNGVVLTGDHILGRGTSVVTWPEGDLTAYLESLRKVMALGPDSLYPGHGPEMTDEPAKVVGFYLEHRAYREEQVIEALAAGLDTPKEMVRRVYADVDERLWFMAEMSTRCALDKLAAEGRARAENEGDKDKERWYLS